MTPAGAGSSNFNEQSTEGVAPDPPPDFVWRRKRVRILKVMVQPILVADDGEWMEQLQTQPVEISAAEWPDYATGRFLEDIAAVEAEINDLPTDR